MFVDETTKISRKSDTPSITRDVGGEGQQVLLETVGGVRGERAAPRWPQASRAEVDPGGYEEHPLSSSGGRLMGSSITRGA